jgi:hypothetical protein
MTAQTVLDTLLVYDRRLLQSRIMPGWVWLIFGALFVHGVSALRTQPALLALLLTLWLTPFVGEWLVSLRRPIFYDRTLIWASLPLYTILAIGVVALRRKLVIAVVLGGLVIAQLLSLHSYYRDFRKEEWRGGGLCRALGPATCCSSTPPGCRFPSTTTLIAPGSQRGATVRPPISSQPACWVNMGVADVYRA